MASGTHKDFLKASVVKEMTDKLNFTKIKELNSLT